MMHVAMMASKNGGIVLPCDVVDEMLMKYCDYETLCNTRELQSTRIRRCTRFDDMEKAIEAGNLENAKWIARNDEWEKKGSECFRVASQFGHLDCLKWLSRVLGPSSFEREGFLYHFAAIGGHLGICIWLLDNGYELDVMSFNGVAASGNVEVMEWCMQNGATFDDWTFKYAAQSDNIEALEYLKFNNCPLGILSHLEHLLQFAQNTNVSPKVLNWLQENGFLSY